MNKSSIKYLVIILSLITTSVKIHGQIFPVEIINYCGAPNEFLNIIILADGYTLSQQEKFIEDARIAANGFLAQEPFLTYKDSINIFALKVVSNVEGASMDPNNLIDNYFGSSFWSYGIERLLVAWKYNKITNVLSENTPFYDKAIVMVNDSKYGGSGGYYAVFSNHIQAIELLLHEFAHSLSGLADEYWAGTQYAAEKPNMTQDNNPLTIRWKEFLNINQIGIYQYPEAPYWYRPHQFCKMQYLGLPYCDVCNNEISNDIMSIVNSDTLGVPIAYFAANNLDIDIGVSVKFYDLSTNRPTSWEWTFVGGTPSSSSLKRPIVTYSSAGKYPVTLRVSNQQGENSITKIDYINAKSSTGTDEFKYDDSINIFPNPAGDLITVSTGSNVNPVKFRILSITGVVVMEGEFKNQIDIAELPSGLYILLFDIKERIIFRKLVKE